VTLDELIKRLIALKSHAVGTAPVQLYEDDDLFDGELVSVSVHPQLGWVLLNIE